MISKQHFAIHAEYGATFSNNLTSCGFDLLRDNPEAGNGPELFLDLSGNLSARNARENGHSDARELIEAGMNQLHLIQISDAFACRGLAERMQKRKLGLGRYKCRIVLDREYKVWMMLSLAGEHFILDFKRAREGQP